MGTWFARDRIERRIAANNDAILELQGQVQRGEARAVGTVGNAGADRVATDASRDQLVEDIKGQLQREMGLVPIRVLRERRASFVPVHSYDESGSLRYGTAGYLGGGYFITVKHGVLALDDSRSERRIKLVKILHDGKEFPATVVDSGSADVEVHSGDWAILKVREEIDLPSLHIDVEYPYDFAETIFRLGNDYSKGIIVSTGYVGQRMENGLVSCLTDGHPGVSGGGVLDLNGNLVGIPVGRMDGDYRFSFILPLRAEMFRKVPDLSATIGGGRVVTD
jgi:Trypsin-like peptidase domain